jgi:hypothetical protein
MVSLTQILPFWFRCGVQFSREVVRSFPARLTGTLIAASVNFIATRRACARNFN